MVLYRPASKMCSPKLNANTFGFPYRTVRAFIHKMPEFYIIFARKIFSRFFGDPQICPLPQSLTHMTLARLALQLEHCVQFAMNEAAEALNCNKNFQGGGEGLKLCGCDLFISNIIQPHSGTPLCVGHTVATLVWFNLKRHICVFNIDTSEYIKNSYI